MELLTISLVLNVIFSIELLYPQVKKKYLEYHEKKKDTIVYKDGSNQ